VSGYVTVRLTLAQAQAASNACDLIRDQYEADGNKREAALYERASKALSQMQRQTQEDEEGA
jgi:hypothetical protein